MVTASASAWLIGGKIDGMRRASIDLPDPDYTGPAPVAGSTGLQVSDLLIFHSPRAETVAAWAVRMNATPPTCACGCGQVVQILPRHRSMGIPRFIHGHHPNPLRRGFQELRAKGYLLVQDVAKALGVSPTTVRRMEAAGAIPKARRLSYAPGKVARVYTVEHLGLMSTGRRR